MTQDFSFRNTLCHRLRLDQRLFCEYHPVWRGINIFWHYNILISTVKLLCGCHYPISSAYFLIWVINKLNIVVHSDFDFCFWCPQIPDIFFYFTSTIIKCLNNGLHCIFYSVDLFHIQSIENYLLFPNR